MGWEDTQRCDICCRYYIFIHLLHHTLYTEHYLVFQILESTGPIQDDPIYLADMEEQKSNLGKLEKEGHPWIWHMCFLQYAGGG